MLKLNVSYNQQTLNNKSKQDTTTKARKTETLRRQKQGKCRVCEVFGCLALLNHSWCIICDFSLLNAHSSITLIHKKYPNQDSSSRKA